MSFRARLALVAAAAVALAVLTASLVIYFVVRDQLRSTVDDSLKTNAAQVLGSPVHDFEHFGAPIGELGGATVYPQGVDANGKVYRHSRLFEIGSRCRSTTTSSRLLGASEARSSATHTYAECIFGC